MADDIKKRILFVAPFPPPLHGSAVVSQQIRDSALINSTFHCDYVNLSASRKLNEVGKPGFVKIWRMFSALCALMGKLLTRRYDICCLAVACHGTAFLKDAPFVLACKLFCRKIVIQQHNKGMSAYVDRWPYRWLLPMVYRGTTVILLSGRLYPDIERVVPKENVLVCPNGIRVGTDGTHERLENDVPQSIADMPRVERHQAVKLRTFGIDVERLQVLLVVVDDAYNATDFDQRIHGARHRHSERDLVNAVALLGDGTGNNVR